MNTCPVCNANLVEPVGRTNAPLLIVGDAPSWQENLSGQVFRSDAGDVLRKELERAGISIRDVRMATLWMHAPIKNNPELKKLCLDWNIAQLFEQMHRVRAVLLLGAEVSKVLLHRPISTINGAVVSSSIIPENVKLVMAAYNPAIVLSDNGVVGDFRFAITRFANETREYRS